MLQALQYSLSAAASTATLFLFRTAAVQVLQLLRCSLTPSASVPLPIQGLLGGTAARCTSGTAGPRVAELSIAHRRHRCGVPGLRLIARPAKRLKLDTQLWGRKNGPCHFRAVRQGGGSLVSPEVIVNPSFSQCFPPPRSSPPHGGATACAGAARPPSCAAEPSSSFIPSAPVATWGSHLG